MKKEDKTNVMRLLDQAHVEYDALAYESKTPLNGMEIAEILGKDKASVFKTLVTVAPSKKNYVFVVPVEKELNLKKAASAVGEKSVAMIKQTELLPLTGYIHGGCSPIGMKKFFKTVIDISASEKEKIIFSGGKVGRHIEMAPYDLRRVIEFEFADITMEGTKK